MRRALTATALVWFVVQPTAAAQVVGARIDNDSFANIDRWYSHRHELFATVPVRDAHLQLRWGQVMWTPRNIQFVEPPERDLSFAGYMYLDVAGLLAWEHHQVQVRGRLGVIGPAAGAGPTQKAIHTLLGVRQPRGWGNQLPNQAAGYVSGSWVFHRAWNVDGLELGGIAQVRADLGNLAVRAELTLMAMVAHGFEASAIDPLLTTRGCERWPCMAFFVGGSARAVAYDLVVDARKAESPPDISRRPVVGTLRWGFMVGGRRAWMRYTHVRQTRMFETNPEVHPKNHRWGVFELVVPYR